MNIKYSFHFKRTSVVIQISRWIQSSGKLWRVSGATTSQVKIGKRSEYGKGVLENDDYCSLFEYTLKGLRNGILYIFQNQNTTKRNDFYPDYELHQTFEPLDWCKSEITVYYIQKG